MFRFSLLLLVILGWLQYAFWQGKNNIHDYQQVSAEVAQQQKINQDLKLRNERMFAEIDNLNNGLDAIEERARNELGMIKPGETFFRIINDSNSK